MSLRKRGNNYYSVIRTAKGELWVPTGKTSQREAAKVHGRVRVMIEREKTTRVLTHALVEIIKQLADEEINVSQAKGLTAGLEAAAWRQALTTVDEFMPAPPTMAADLWERYQRNAPELKESSLKTKEQRFHKFQEWAGEMDMKDINEPACRRFLKFLDTEKSQTINNYISDLSSVWKLTPELPNPWGEHLRKRSNVTRKNAFTVDQIRDLIKYCAANNRPFWLAAITIAYYTGLRLTDVIHLQWTQITDDGYIDLSPAKTMRNKKHVRIPVREKLRNMLDTLLHHDLSLYIFPEEVKKYTHDRSISTTEFRGILRGCKIEGKGYGFHSIRHTFVTLATDAGNDQEQIQAVVGHSAAAVTDGYYHGIKNTKITDYPDL